VQIADYSGGRRRIVAHVGSAQTEAELRLPVKRARDLLEDDRQGVLELGIEPRAAKVTLVSAVSEPALFDALDGVFTDLGFDGLGGGGVFLAREHALPEPARRER